ADCMYVPRENATPEPAKLGACRRPGPAASQQALTRFKRGESKLGYDNYPDAVDAFEQAVKEAPEWPAAWFRLGQAAEKARQWKRAKEAYHRYLELEPSPPEYPALIKRLASVDYEIGLDERDERE